MFGLGVHYRLTMHLRNQLNREDRLSENPYPREPLPHLSAQIQKTGSLSG